MARIARIFVANRGEIAVRIIRTARALGIETVLGVSTADTQSLAAKLATQVVCLGPALAADSYLRVDTVVQAALGTGCDALHPGYGFLSENHDLATACATHGLIFIGPTPANLAAVGDKLTARSHAIAADVPLVPGGNAASLAEAEQVAAVVGYPLLIKAVAGGGGKGMKRVDTAQNLGPSLTLAMAEASAAFGDDRVYLERYVTTGRHIEVQILSDGTTVLHAGDRDCSVQRRYQKLLEEAPAPDLSPALRNAITDAALRYARHIGFVSLGTVEFLVDGARDAFYFLEMNARIQVEHPVTEAVTGLDLIALQIEIAQGQPLALRQHDLVVQGHAIECRLNAEDMTADFRPCPGQARFAWFPAMPGLRVDTHLETGTVITAHYDSLVAKLVAHAPTRAAAIAVMTQALAAMRLDGLTTNAPLHRAIMADAAFVQGGVDTTYLAGLLSRLAGGAP
jgi:acetyl-CoA carboxylase, biotin carboxylase subunit